MLVDEILKFSALAGWTHATIATTIMHVHSNFVVILERRISSCKAINVHNNWGMYVQYVLINYRATECTTFPLIRKPLNLEAMNINSTGLLQL